MVLGGWHLDRRPGDHGLRVGEQSYRQPHDRFTGDHRPVRTHRAGPDHRGCGGGSPDLPDDGAG